MGSLYLGQLIGFLTAVLGFLLFAYVRENRRDQDDVIEAYLLDIKRNTDRKEHRISKKLTTIGRARSRDIDVCIPKGTISELHAQIEYRNGNFYLTDLRSLNGTYLNGAKEKVTGQTYMRHGDIIEFGDCMLKFVVPEKVKQKVRHSYRDSYEDLHNRTVFKASSD